MFHNVHRFHVRGRADGSAVVATEPPSCWPELLTAPREASLIPHKTIDVCAPIGESLPLALARKERFHSQSSRKKRGSRRRWCVRDLELSIAVSWNAEQRYLPQHHQGTGTISRARGAEGVLVGSGISATPSCLFRGPAAERRVVASFDSDPRKSARLLGGCPCLPMTHLDQTVRQHDARRHPDRAGACAANHTALVAAGIAPYINFHPGEAEGPEGNLRRLHRLLHCAREGGSSVGR